MAINFSSIKPKTLIWIVIGAAVLITLILLAVVYGSQLATTVATAPVKVSGTITAKGPRIAVTQGLRYKTVLPQPTKAKKVEVCWLVKKQTRCRVLASSVKGNQVIVTLPVSVPKGAATIKVTERLATGALGPVLYSRAVLVKPRVAPIAVQQESDGGGGGGGGGGDSGQASIEEPTPTPEISPSASPSPSATPTVSPIVSPTPSPSVSPSPSISPTPTPTPSPSPSPSPSPTPEIDIQGNSVSIIDGDTTPALSDHTDFGSAIVGKDTVIRRYTVRNTGTGSLTLGNLPTFSGTHASDFSIIDPLSTPIAAGATTTFDVKFIPGAAGIRTANISLTNNDANENPYNFAIRGTGTVPTPTPTPSPSVTPTPTPSVSPSPSPSPTPSPTPSPSPSVSPSPTIVPAANFTVPVDDEVWLAADPLDIRVQITKPASDTIVCQEWKLDGVPLPASAWVPGQTPFIQPCS